MTNIEIMKMALGSQENIECISITVFKYCNHATGKHMVFKTNNSVHDIVYDMTDGMVYSDPHWHDNLQIALDEVCM
jgi:hypothetical protein